MFTFTQKRYFRARGGPVTEKFAAFFQNGLQKTFLACNLYRRVLVIEKVEESQR